MKVSVLIITYNQEGMIAQALDSALMQRVNFPYEIIIGEDASTDRTREMVLGFQRKHPDKIRVMIRDAATSEHERAHGIGGKTNFVQSLRDCRGAYVALLDGDDYWTDPSKLQKQVDFLDSNPDFAICFHNATVFYQDGSRPPVPFSARDQKDVSTLEDLLRGNFIFNSSVVFRNRLFGELPNWFDGVLMGDWALHLMNAQHGRIRYLNETMAAYRVHDRGFSTSVSPLQHAEDKIRVLSRLDKQLDPSHKKHVQDALSYAYQTLSQVYYERGEFTKSREALHASLRICIANHSIPSRHLIGRMIKLRVYRLFELVKALKLRIRNRDLR